MAENWIPKKGDIIYVSESINGDKKKRKFLSKDESGYVCHNIGISGYSKWYNAWPIDFDSPANYIPIDEQLEIQNNMIGDLNKPKMGDPSFKIHNDGDLRASKRRLAELETCDLFANSEALKEWNCIHYAIAEYLKTTSPEPNKPLFIYQERLLLEFGDLYEFYDDENYSQELVLIGQGAGKYFGISQDDYDEITKGWEGTVHAYNNVREVKVYPEITPEQIAEKFDIPVTKLVIEGYNKITDEEKKEAINKIMFSASNNCNNGLLDKEMD